MDSITETKFNYEEIDPETRISLKQRASRIGERTRRMATDIWENGREFAEAQQELASYGNGRFLAWVETETGYSKSTVYRMIDVHERLDFPKLGKTDIAASALYLLASASTPDEAREEAMQAAEQGEVISHGRAKEIVQTHKPKPSTDNMRKRLRQSLRDEMYATYQVTGITDADLRQVLGRDWGLGGGSSGPDRTAVYKKGGSNPGFWYNSFSGSGKPTLRGKALLDLVRELLELPYPNETAVPQSAPSPSPFYVGPMAQGPEVREALKRYLAQWPANSDFIIMRLANVEASGHEKEMADAVAALGASDAAIYHQAMVLRNNLPGPSWEREKRAVETAAIAPESITQQIIADVEAGYEKEWETAVPASVIPARAAHADARLTSLNDAVSIVTRLTVDTSLTIDVVGPLARALGLMEDAKKALTKRQDYINWLRDYRDDDGRRWTDLSDTQTWHKNSPCYQAFVKAFPGEDFAKSALMDAKTQLERETAEEAS